MWNQLNATGSRYKSSSKAEQADNQSASRRPSPLPSDHSECHRTTVDSSNWPLLASIQHWALHRPCARTLLFSAIRAPPFWLVRFAFGKPLTTSGTIGTNSRAQTTSCIVAVCKVSRSLVFPMRLFSEPSRIQPYIRSYIAKCAQSGVLTVLTS